MWQIKDQVSLKKKKKIKNQGKPKKMTTKKNHSRNPSY